LVVLIAFLMVRAIGGNPFVHGPIGLPGNTPETFQPEVLPEVLEEEYHFSDPWYVHYLRYVRGLFTFDFGPSTQFPNREVRDIIAAQAPRSLLLGSLALAWALLLGLPAGVLAALRANSWLGYALTAVASVSLALPSFLVGTLLIYFLSVRLGLLPTSGWETWRHMLMPALALGLAPLGYVIRIVRGTMLETLAQDYVRVAAGQALTGLGRPEPSRPLLGPRGAGLLDDGGEGRRACRHDQAGVRGCVAAGARRAAPFVSSYIARALSGRANGDPVSAPASDGIHAAKGEEGSGFPNELLLWYPRAPCWLVA
jgi:hypothetical protein